ncbi:MAG: tripartite tricarboxylate transporter substrate-binding protein [Burkholderiales bacterium]
MGTSYAQPAPSTVWPAKPVTIVVPYSAGGGTDTVGRLVAQRLSERWGVSVVVENRTGANGAIGSALVAKAAPDGNTLLLVVGSHAINPVLMKSLPYDTATAFTPITRIAVSPMVLVASAKGPFQNLNDALAVARKDEIGIGFSEGQTRLTGEMMRQAGGLRTIGIPYKGGAPMMVDLIGGHLPLGLTSVLTALPHVQAGNLIVIGVAADQRMALFPEAMTFQEAGLKDVESLNWYGLFGPAGMSEAVVARINADLGAVAAAPAFAKQMKDQGAEIVLTPPEQFVKLLEQETAKWRQVAQRAGIQPE